MSPQEPLRLGRLDLRNRWVLAPMTTYSSYDSGLIHPDELTYLQRRAEGGFGLVMTAACYVHPRGKAFQGQWGCDNDDKMGSLESVARAIHAGGARAVLQIHHGGRQCSHKSCGGQPLCPSPIPMEREGAETPAEMTAGQIEEAIEAFGQAARRAEQAGFDGVEIHGANTYLLQQFVSPHSNRRDDGWGADRCLFSCRVVERCLAQVSEGFPVGYRFSPEEPWEPGIDLEQTDALLKRLCGYPLAFLHVSLSRWDQDSIRSAQGEPTLSRVFRPIRGRIPLIGVGSIASTHDAEACLSLGASLVAVGKAAILNPHFPVQEATRTQFPKEGAEALLTLPNGLVQRILGAPGWFPVED